jgi:hypothetical protein
MQTTVYIALRSLAVAAGVALISAAFWVGYITLVFLGGGHQSPFGQVSWSEWVFRLAILGIPVALGALGIACLIYRTRRDRRRPGFVLLALAIDLIVLIATAAYSKTEYTSRHSHDPCEGLPASACTTVESKKSR